MAGNGHRKEKGNVIGAVMVVGGGIAGMQTALDLAESGFKVYLVEAKSAIGGHMAQLDKTFPTNDCAMCNISPKLVDVGRHPNINILTQTEVEHLNGQAGDFTVTVRRKPRYIDLNKCTACGDCAEVCPVVIPSRFNLGLAKQRAAYKLYPQAIPNAYAIEKRGIAPCRDACPAHQRAQGYIALIREGRYEDALRVIKEDNPFPGICGRICNHRCEDACNRGKVDEPVNIHALKRFVTDKVYAAPRVPPEPVPRKYEERVAIIGAGPCGLTTAQDLCKMGYPVTVFEALPVAGGMLRVGVPEYRLPGEIVDREVQDIIDLGVDLRLNTTVENLDDLFDAGFKAVLIAVGAHEGVRLPIPGNDLDGVLINTHFLREVRLHDRSNGDSPRLPEKLAGLPFKQVLVIGGGNVAIDVARTAVRLGAGEVAMAFLETRDTMPAHEWEIQAALDEGIKLFPGRSFTRIVDNGRGGVAGVECLNVRSFSFDSQGRLELETEPGSEHEIECDTVIFSVGQRAGLAFIPEDAGVGLTPSRSIAVNPNTFAATRPGVFAAGDSVSGTAFVIEAVASGHKCAQSIHRHLRGEALEPKPKPELPVVKLAAEELETRRQQGEIRITPRLPMPELPLEQRVRNFAEVAQGYTDELAQAEAARCLACGVCSECLSCQYICGVGAVIHDMVEQMEAINVGAIILAPGYQVYRAELSEEYGFGRYPNVVTSLQFERLLSASGPTMGHVKRPSDGETPKKIAFLQCVGSRDQSHDYCSAVCCMYAAKEAIMAKEHEPETEVHVFMIDMRAFSKGYEAYYRRAQDTYGIKYTRCRISSLKEDPATKNLILSYLDEAPNEQIMLDDSRSPDSRIRHGPIRQEEFDLVVLSVGMEISASVKALGHRLGIELDEYGFCHTVPFDPLQTSQPGIYAVGPFREPKDIPESVIEASGAAAVTGGLLATARHTLTRTVAYPPERDVSQEEVKTAVFVCHCGTNIGGFVDVPDVAHYAESLPNVIHAEDNLYTCSQDSIAHITEKVKELGANRVVVASCTPLTHEPLFQSSIQAAGLNPYLFEMANIRNHCSWIHSHNREIATRKAKDLVRMAVARAAELQPLYTTELPVEQTALVIGGGAAGMNAALSLAEQNFPVHLVERTAELGGNLRHVHYFYGEKSKSTEPQAYLADLIERVKAEPLITLHLETEFEALDGFKGNFTATLRNRNGTFAVKHGVIIVATGGVEYKGKEYGYGTNARILTQQEFEEVLAEEMGRWGDGEIGHGKADGLSKIPPQARRRNPKSKIQNVVMIQCVGPAERFCGRICCTTALKNALKLKELNPNAQVTVVYRDIRTYGFKERLYTQARAAGVLFVRYDFDRKPEVICNGPAGQKDGEVMVRVWEPVLGKTLTLKPDLLVLSTPLVPSPGARALASKLKVSVDMDDFFLEAHVKLRPVDFSSEGIFMCGLAHYPKFLDESIIQAQAAASRAATILSQEKMTSRAQVAIVDQTRCVGCLTCVRVCPYDVPKIDASLPGVGDIVGAAQIEPTVCQGCGVCVAECPAKAIQLRHYTDGQVVTKLDALFERI